MSIGPTHPRVHIGRVIRNAIVFNPGNWDAMAANADSLLDTVDHLFALLEAREIDFLLVGGVAMLHYVDGRNTEDIDLIMAVSDLDRLPELQPDERDADFASGRFEDLRVDLLLTSNPLFRHVLEHQATTSAFAERTIPCATVDGLLLLKLYALPALYRQGNFARVGLYENDVATLMQAHRPDMVRLLSDLAPHLSASDLAAVREIVDEIGKRIERFGRGLAGQ